MKNYCILLSLIFTSTITSAQFKKLVPAELHLKNGKVIYGDAKIPLKGKNFSYRGKESIRFLKRGDSEIKKYDETSVDYLILQTTHTFKVKENKKKVKKSLIISDKFVYQFLGYKNPQLVKEITVGSQQIFEKIQLLKEGGQASGIIYFNNAHMYSSKGLARYGHYFYHQGQEKELTLLPKTKKQRFIDLFGSCSQLIKSYESFNRQLHPVEVVELLKKFPDVQVCSENNETVN